MHNSVVNQESAMVVRDSKTSLKRRRLVLCKLHRLSKCGAMLEPESKDPKRRGTRGDCPPCYEVVRREVADGHLTAEEAEALGYWGQSRRGVTKQMAAEVTLYRRQEQAVRV